MEIVEIEARDIQTAPWSYAMARDRHKQMLESIVDGHEAEPENVVAFVQGVAVSGRCVTDPKRRSQLEELILLWVSNLNIQAYRRNRFYYPPRLEPYAHQPVQPDPTQAGATQSFVALLRSDSWIAKRLHSGELGDDACMVVFNHLLNLADSGRVIANPKHRRYLSTFISYWKSVLVTMGVEAELPDLAELSVE